MSEIYQKGVPAKKREWFCDRRRYSGNYCRAELLVVRGEGITKQNKAEPRDYRVEIKGEIVG